MPVNSREIFNRLINGAGRGVPEARGNTDAQKEIPELEQSPITPPPVPDDNPPSIVWPAKVKREKRGPQLGDIPEHNNI